MKKIIAFVLVSLLVSISWALPAHAQNTPELEVTISDNSQVVASVAGDEASNRMIQFLTNYGVECTSNTVITVLGSEKSARNASNSSVVYVHTEENGVFEDNFLVTYCEDELGNVVKADAGAALLVEPRGSTTDNYTWSGTTIKATTVYERVTTGGRNYVRPTGEYFTCFKNTNGIQPSKVTINTVLGGELYNVSNGSYVSTGNEYLNQWILTKNTPAFNTMYSKNISFSASQAVEPLPWVHGLGFEVEAVIGGDTFFENNPISYRWG